MVYGGSWGREDWWGKRAGKKLKQNQTRLLVENQLLRQTCDFYSCPENKKEGNSCLGHVYSHLNLLLGILSHSNMGGGDS